MDNLSWEYHAPVFESDKFNPEMLIYSPWSGHRRFAYDYVINRNPGCIVELGSYYGCSAFAFLQAIKDFSLDTSFYAIDTWMGDSFTEGDYKENIFESYRTIQEGVFSKQNAHMLRMTFDQANGSFEDCSIDLLHIDGSHTYEDCRHDFETWLPKVKQNGVVFFHDISDDKLEGELLGSHLFWNEVKEQFPFTMEFSFSFGLGILFLDEKVYRETRAIIDFDYYQRMENHAAVTNKDVIRKRYFELRDANKYIEFLKDQISICNSHLHEYEKTQKEKDAYIQELEKRTDHLTNICKNNDMQFERIHSEYENNLEEYRKNVDAKDAYIVQLEDAIKQFEKNVFDKDTYIGNVENQVVHLNQVIHELMDDVARVNEGRERAIGDYKKTLEGKEAYIEELKADIQKYENTIAGKDNYIKELHETIEKYAATVDGKESYIQELLSENSEFKNSIQEHMSMNAALEKQNQQLQQDFENVYIEKNNKEVRVSSLEEELKQAMLMRQADQECILNLQQENALITKQFADLKDRIKKLPFGRHIIDRMEKRSVEI